MGYMSFWTVFIIVEIMKIVFQLNAALLNICCFLQFSIIMNLDWTDQYRDKVQYSTVQYSTDKRLDSSEYQTILSNINIFQKVVTISLLMSLFQVAVLVCVDYILVWQTCPSIYNNFI